MTPTELTPSAWGEIADTVNRIIVHDPIRGALTVALSIAVVISLVAVATWSVIQVIRAKNPPKVTAYTLLDSEKFTQGVMSLVQDLVNFNSKRDQISRKHERIQETQITKEQMNLFEGMTIHLRNSVMLSFSEHIRRNLEEHLLNEVMIELPEYKMFDYAMQRSVETMLRSFRRIVKEEQFLEKTDIEFRAYVEQSVLKLITIAKQAFESNYFMRSVSLQEAIVCFEKEFARHRGMIDQTFMEVREIAHDYMEGINREEEQYSREWLEFVSSIPQRILQYIHGKGDSHDDKK